MRTIKDIKDLYGKKVLLRSDFDVPVIEGKIAERFRIKKQRPVIDFLLKQASIVIAAHIKGVASFKKIAGELQDLIGYNFEIVGDLKDIGSKTRTLKPGRLFLLENTRNWPGEEKNDRDFAKLLADDLDIYINNAFAVSHRRHASVSAITEFLPSCAGFLIEEEVSQLSKMIDLPKDGKIFIMGGAKALTKVPVIKNFIGKAENILLGGVVANDILKARGLDVGLSMVDENVSELLRDLDINDKSLVVPADFNVFEKRFLDIGPQSIKKFIDIICNSKTIIWNGPLGLFEDERFSSGTNEISKAVACSDAFKVIGGGDTISAVDKLCLLDKFDFVSTGGGAMLEFLAGNRLPGLEALGYYE